MMIENFKFTELHRHLDASLRPETIADLVREYQIEGPYQTKEQVKQNFWLTQPLNSLKEVLDRFVLFQKVLKTPEVLERIAYEATIDAYHENISHLELRYSPAFTSEFSNIPWEIALNAFDRGIKRAQLEASIQVGLIAIVSRDYGEKSAHEVIEFALSHKDKIIGLDLAGNEAHYPNKLFQTPFQKAIQADIPITIHAGEAAGAESVWSAIDLLGAKRIGHGIQSIHDSTLLKRLAKDQILIESCPSSNWITNAVSDWASHPLPKWLDLGIPVSIATDDPGIFGVSMPEEYLRCQNHFQFTLNDFNKINKFALSHSFLPR